MISNEKINFVNAAYSTLHFIYYILNRILLNIQYILQIIIDYLI